VKAAVAVGAVAAAAGTFLASQAGAAQVKSPSSTVGKKKTAPVTKNLVVRVPAGTACLAVAVKPTHAQVAPSLVEGHPSFLVEVQKANAASWVNTRHHIQVRQWVRFTAFAGSCASVANQKLMNPSFISHSHQVSAVKSTDDRFSPVWGKPATTQPRHRAE
jgi:hypothetical protein